jgi:metallophosphoesterase superfamily enzyme
LKGVFNGRAVRVDELALRVLNREAALADTHVAKHTNLAADGIAVVPRVPTSANATTARKCSL